MRRLMLLRHAKSDWPEGLADHERPLAARGRGAAPLMARYMVAEGLLPDLALVSPARRTRETWDLVAQTLGRIVPVTSESRIYQGRVDGLMAMLTEIEAAVDTVLVVGHNPAMAELTLLLSGAGDRRSLAAVQRKFPTAGLSVIRIESDWADIAPFKGRLERFVTPKSLGGEDD
jgi:phosphohistidine phosphatase